MCPEIWEMYQALVADLALAEMEQTLLRGYIQHLHPSARFKFLQNAMDRGREFLDPYLDTELEAFGEEKFEGQAEGKRSNVDLYGAYAQNDPVKKIVVYKEFVNRLRDIDQQKRGSVYKNYGFDPLQKFASIGKKRMALYAAFSKKMRALSRKQVEVYIDQLFDEDKESLAAVALAASKAKSSPKKAKSPRKSPPEAAKKAKVPPKATKKAKSPPKAKGRPRVP